MYNIAEQKERLGRRIAAIQDPALKRDLRHYRTNINKRAAIDARGARATIQSTPRGARYKASDEIMLCHAFLDTRGAPTCY